METTPVESTPTPTADVAEQVLDAFEQTETTAVEPAEPIAEPPAVVEPPKELSAEEQLLQEFGFKQAFKPDGREHYIPRSKVLQMIGSGLKRGHEQWTTEKTTLSTRAQELEGQLTSFVQAIKGEPKAFLSEIAKHDARYQAFLEQQSAPPPAPVSEMPQPDVPLPDGSRTYSVEGIQKLIEWAVDAKMLPKVDERLKPITEREKRAEEAALREEMRQRDAARASSIMKEAQTWPLFGPIAPDGKLSPFQQEVYAAWQADQSLDLRAAYMKVALPRLTEDDNKKRERLLKELDSAPKSTATSRQPTDAPRTTGAATTAEIAARTLARLEKGA